MSRLRLLALAYKLARVTTFRVLEASSQLLFPSWAAGVAEVAVPGGRVEVPLADSYWSRLVLDPDWRYEPEVADTLARMEPEDVFIDCGANIGLWSLAAGNRISDERIVAVEAAGKTFERLARNRALSGRSFACVHAALFERGGEVLRIQTPVREHAGAHLEGIVGASVRPIAHVEEVTSITIDELSAQLPGARRAVFLKLDVEGAEVSALRGASALLRDNAVVLLYEDHGNDIESHVTAYVLQSLGMSVFLATDRGWLQVREARDLRPYKTDSFRGYNCVATNDSHWARTFQGAS